MIDLKNKNVLCNTKNEVMAIFEEAIRQNVIWCTGAKAYIEDAVRFDSIPVVLCFDSSNILSWNELDDCDKDGYFVTDLAKDLLNKDREMTAHEFLNKYLDMTDGDCGFCENCKTISCDFDNGAWCDPAYWTKDNIKQVYEIVKSGNKLKEKPEKKAANNIRKYLDGDEQLNIDTLKLAIKVLEEKLNEKQK